MKLTTKQENVKVLDESISTSNFKISMGPKMFSILSDGLYSDKILACVRELSTNALDAHKAASAAQKPFDVHLPTWNNPLFYIRDYGIGMSKEDMESLYSTYGMSSKDTSDEYTGCLGLGSKTPFAYNTRTFIVTSFFNGNKYEYQCIIDTNGIPSISLISEESTTEPNGLKVAFPVKRGDENTFASRASKVYEYFETKPNFVGHKIPIPEVKYSYFHSSKKWGIRQAHSNYNNESRIIMGAIAYPINYNHFDSKFSTLLSNGKIDIYANIGDVSIEVSREGLSYDSQTKLFITGIINGIIKEANSNFEKSIIGQKSLWDARKEAKKIWNSYQDSLREFISVNTVKWNNILLFPNNSFSWNIDKDSYDYCQFFEYSAYGRSRVRQSDASQWRCTIDTDFTIVEDDLKTTGIARIKEAVTARQYNQILLIKFTDPVLRQKFLDSCGIVDESIIVKTSTLNYTKPVRAPGVKRGKIGTGLSFDRTASLVTKQWVNENSIDYTQPGVYVGVNGYRIEGSKIPSNSTLRTILINIGYNGTIYGLKKSSLKKAQAAGWKHIDDVLKLEIEAYIKKNANSIGKTHLSYYMKELLALMIAKNMSKDATFNKYAQELCKIGSSNIDIVGFKKTYYDDIFYLGSPSSIKEVDDADKNTLDMLKYCKDKYPIISDIEVESIYPTNIASIIKKYCALVDSI